MYREHMHSFLLTNILVVLMSASPALACKMIMVDGEMVVAPECPTAESMADEMATHHPTTKSIHYKFHCGSRELSFYASQNMTGGEKRLSVVTVDAENDRKRLDYSDALMAYVRQSHDVHRAKAQCFDNGTQIGVHIPSESGDDLNLLLAGGRVMMDFDRRARGEWYDQRKGARRVERETFILKCDANGSANALRECLDRRRSETR